MSEGMWRRRTSRATAACAIACALAVVSLGPHPALAQVPPDDEAASETPIDLATVPPVETPGVDPVLDAVEVDDTGPIRRANDDLEAAAEAQSRAVLGWIQAEQERQKRATRRSNAEEITAATEAALAVAQRDQDAKEDELLERTIIQADLRSELRVEQDELRDLAAEVFTGTSIDRYAILGSFDDFTVADRRDAARDRTVDVQVDRVDDATVPWKEARDRTRDQQKQVDQAAAVTTSAFDDVAAATSERDESGALLATAEAAERDAKAALDDARDEAKAALADRRSARLEAQVTGLDMPLVALHAYWRASSLAPCRIPWWIIAGVGKVETRHGTAFGSKLTSTGDTTVHILGIPLDGRPGVAAIPDTDGGRLDDDGTWDRAVGPMQFIPGTWNRWASDGNADEIPDPHNLYDAAGAAAKYLCYSRGDLVTEAAIRGALLAYNRSVPYGTKVLAEGNRYREALDLPDDAPRPGDPVTTDD